MSVFKESSIEKKKINIIFIVSDLSGIGGVQTRTKNVLRAGNTRNCEYIAISLRYDREFSMQNAYSLDRDEQEIIKILTEYSAKDTVLIIGNSIHSEYPPNIRKLFYKFPIIALSATQMAFMIQDSDILLRQDFLKENMASCILSFSDGDIAFQRQLGIHGQRKIAPSVEIRKSNQYDLDRNKVFGYIGRLDFHTKDCERLIDIAHSFKKSNLPPLHIFTTNGRNSPDYQKFIEIAYKQDILDHLEITLNCEDKVKMFSKLKMLILPSKKEASGNAILEAFSFDVPVLAASYAPGPAEIIISGSCGILLDDMSGDNALQNIEGLSDKKLKEMSGKAFERHKDFSITAHIDAIENIALEIIEKFDGFNKLLVLPRLRSVDILMSKLTAHNSRAERS